MLIIKESIHILLLACLCLSCLELLPGIFFTNKHANRKEGEQ